jgi:predicted lipoprotein with Yx(FWY)xxD motif
VIQVSTVAAAIGGAALLSACSSYQKGSGHPAGPQQPTGQTSRDATATQDGQGTPTSGQAARLVATQSSVGTIVADGSGRSLYRFDKDTASPSASNCTGECATMWPPVTVTRGGRVEVRGVSQSEVGSIRRSDGTWQVTVGGWPVYRYALDQNAGDMKGQGVGGTWFAVTPTGKKASGSSTGDSGQNGNGGYGSGNGSGQDGGGYGAGGY